MNATGVSKQEEKIEGMANVVSDLHPGMTHLTVKGAFRFAIQESLKEHGFTDWKEVAGQPASTRKRFFEQLCDHAASRVVRLGFPQDKTPQLKERLQEMNQRYVRN